MSALPENLERKLTRLGSTLIDAKRANPIIEPSQDDDGFWFGGGNAVRDPHDGSLLLIGRYRDAGGRRSVVSTIVAGPDTDPRELGERLGRYRTSGFDTAVVLALPGGPSTAEILRLLD